VSLTASGPGGSDTLTRTNCITVSSGMAYTTTHRVISYTYHNSFLRIDPTREGWYTIPVMRAVWFGMHRKHQSR